MRLSTIMSGYLLSAKPFPGPILIHPPGFILNYTHNEHELDPNLCVFIKHYDISKTVCSNWIYPLQIESKQTLFMYHKQSKTWFMQYVWPALRSGFASGHRVALVVHRAQKSVLDSAGEWPTFSPPPFESCSGTANVDGQNCESFSLTY